MRKNDLLFSAIYMILMLVAASRLFRLEDMSSAVISAKLYPWLIIGTGLVMGAVETGRAIFAPKLANEPSLAQIWSRAFASRRIVLLVLFIAYLALIPTLHFIYATGLFCFTAMVALSPRRNPSAMLLAAGISIVTIGAIYLLLVVYLQAFLP